MVETGDGKTDVVYYDTKNYPTSNLLSFLALISA
jgi:hypothetical protein